MLDIKDGGVLMTVDPKRTDNLIDPNGLFDMEFVGFFIGMGKLKLFVACS